MNDKELMLLNEQRLAEFYRKAMEICSELIVDYHKFKKARTENGFINALNKVFDGRDYSEKNARGITLRTKYLMNLDYFVHKRAYSFRAHEIENRLDKIRNASVNDSIFGKTLEILTSDNSVATMRKLLDSYLSCYKKINELKGSIYVPKKEEVHQEEVIDSDKAMVGDNHLYYLDKVLGLIKSKINDPNSSTDLTLEELNYFKELLPNFGSIRGVYYSSDTVCKGLSINNKINNLSLASKNKNVSILDSPLKMVCDVANLVFDTTTLLLLSDNSNEDFDSVSRMLKLDKGLEQYSKAYDLFSKCFNSMSRHAKDDMRIAYQGVSFDEYRIKFGITNFHIINVNELKNRINTYIKVFISKKSSSYTSTVVNDKIYNKLLRATKLMDVSDVVELYRMMYDNEMREYNYSVNHADILNLEINLLKNAYIRRNIVLQDTFANIVANKISNISAVKKNLSNEDLLKKEALLVMICQDYFHEAPKFGLSADDDTILTQTVNLRVGIETSTKMEARDRFYGMKKFKRGIARIDGTWKKYNELMNKERLDNDDIDQLNKMFI